MLKRGTRALQLVWALSQPIRHPLRGKHHMSPIPFPNGLIHRKMALGDVSRPGH